MAKLILVGFASCFKAVSADVSAAWQMVPTEHSGELMDCERAAGEIHSTFLPLWFSDLLT